MHESFRAGVDSSKRVTQPLAAAAAVAVATMLAAPASAATFNYANINNGPWDNATTWSLLSGTDADGIPDSDDALDISGFTAGNAILLNNVSRSITGLKVSGGFASTTLSLRVNSSDNLAGRTVTITDTLEVVQGITSFNNLTPNLAKAAVIKNGAVRLSTGSSAESLKSFTLDNGVTFTRAGNNQAGELVLRSGAGQAASLTVGGPISIAGVGAGQTYTTTFTLDANNSTATNAFTLNGNLSGNIQDSTINVQLRGTGQSAQRNTFTIGGTGNSDGLLGGTASKLLLGKLSVANTEAFVDFNLSRASALGSINTVQLGDGTSTAAKVDLRLLGTGAYTVNNKINLTGYAGTTASAAYTIGGTHASGLLTYGGAVSLSKPVSLLTQTSGATTAFTGGITANANDVTIAGDGTTVLAGAVSGTGKIAVSSGATFSAGASADAIGLLTLSGGEDLELRGTSRFDIASGTSYDRVAGVDALSYGGTLVLDFDAVFGSNAVLDLFALASSSDGLTAVSLAGSYVASLSNSGGVWTGTTAGASFTFIESTGDLAVVVPEPGTTLAFAALSTGLLAHRRRRTR